MLWSGLAIGLVVMQPARSEEAVDVVEVVGQTPLGAGIEIDKLASNVQSVSADELREQRALDLADFMQRNLASVFINEAQSNPLQPDVQYRGFVGSPLLGLPQGIAVYQDGIRVNEAFGDTVNWALIPESAIDSVYLMPGSNPMFGLNALGGAVSIHTKNGFTSPGSYAEVYGGSFGRLGLQAETGRSNGKGFGYFVTGAYIREEGWRDYSPTEAVQFFGDLGWRTEASRLHLDLTVVDTDLVGNGPLPIQLLESDRRAIYTRPDRTQNDLLMANLVGNHEVSDRLTLTGNIYVRGSDIETYNGDDSDFEECAGSPGFMCETDDGAETVIVDPLGAPVPASADVTGGSVSRTMTLQESMGTGLQAAWSIDRDGRRTRLVLGGSYDHSDVDFASSLELGQLDATRRAVPGGYLAGDSLTRLLTRTAATGLFASAVVDITERLTLTVAGRYNDVDIDLRDRLGTALNGSHSFNRFNPALGLTLSLGREMTLYAGYSESNRVPSPVELTCADEDDPCRLPNAFLADPPLKQVVGATYEAGLRGRWNNGDWHAGIFRASNQDDILFISAGALTNEGYFDNVGETLREGVELNLRVDAGRSSQWFINYTYLDATFDENLLLPSANNPAATDGEVNVRRGDRLPLIPRHLAKAGFQSTFGERLTIAGTLVAGSDFYMRGDEGNDLSPVGDYAVVNVRADYELNSIFRLFLNIDNLFDAEYESFGLFGEADEVLGDEFDDSRFLSPAAPLGAWLGVQATF